MTARSPNHAPSVASPQRGAREVEGLHSGREAADAERFALRSAPRLRGDAARARYARGVFFAFFVATAAFAQPTGPTHRYAVIVGNDFGGDGTRPLLYAKDDAKKVHDILTRLGGIAPEDASLLLDAHADDLLTALGEIERKARDAGRRGERTMIFVYYSGHAKDGALRLGDSKLPFESLKSRLAQAPADVRIAVFDACRSGSMTRSKGARKAPAFEVENDATRAAKGLVILTSSASDEDSQESDQIGGSYFSHHLASALVGDADVNRDNRITLSEAYAYAYDRTVADTAESAAGAQHPTFSYDLAGNGDVVLTDFAQRREGILLPASAPAGSYYVVNREGFVSAEIVKLDGIERRIALKEGRYKITRRLPNKLRVTEVEVTGGATTTVDESSFRDMDFADDPVKGPGRSIIYSKHSSFAFNGTYQAIFDQPTAAGGVFPSTTMLGLDYVSHNFFGRGWSLGLDVSLGGTNGSLLVSSAQETPYKYSELDTGGSLICEWPEGDWVPFAAVRLSLMLTTTDFTDDRIPTQSWYVFTPGLVGGVKYRFTRHWFVSGRMRAQYLPYNVGGKKGFGYGEFATLMGYEL